MGGYGKPDPLGISGGIAGCPAERGFLMKQQFTMSAKEKRFSRAIYCRHCNNATVMEIVAIYSALIDVNSQGEEYPPIMEGDIYQLLACPV